MFVDRAKNMKIVNVNVPGAFAVIKQTLVGPEQGWDGWVMRLFTLAEGGYTPRHTHPWPHINYIVSGKGTLLLAGEEHQMKPGSIAYIPDNAEHQFMNCEQEDFSFICIVPKEGDF